jgi:hypothetical protein
MVVNTDSRLETYIKGQQKRTESVKEKVARKKRENVQLKADNLVNKLVERRGKIEARSALMVGHQPTVVGSAPIPEPEDADMLGRPMFSKRQVESRKPTDVYSMVESELPKIAPGLVPQRMKAINQAAPSDAKVFRTRFLDVVKGPIDLRSEDHSSHSGRTDVWSAMRYGARLHADAYFRDGFDDTDYRGWHKRHYDYLKRMKELGTDHKEGVEYINNFIRAKKKLPHIPGGTIPGTPFTMPPPPGTPMTPLPRPPVPPFGPASTRIAFPRGVGLGGARPSTG